MYIKKLEKETNEALIERLKKPHRAYDWDVATQNLLLIRIAEKVLSEKKVEKPKKKKDAGTEE